MQGHDPCGDPGEPPPAPLFRTSTWGRSGAGHTGPALLLPSLPDGVGPTRMSPAPLPSPATATEERYRFALQPQPDGTMVVWTAIHVAASDQEARAWLELNGMRPHWDRPLTGPPMTAPSMSGTIVAPPVRPKR